MKKMIEDQPRKWHEKLSEALWAYRNAKTNATGFTPYQLTYGMHAVVPAEVNVISTRVRLYEDIKAEAHKEMMHEQLISLDEVRASAEER